MDMDSLKGQWPIKFYISLYDFVHNLMLILILKKEKKEIIYSFEVV